MAWREIACQKASPELKLTDLYSHWARGHSIEAFQVFSYIPKLICEESCNFWVNSALGMLSPYSTANPHENFSKSQAAICLFGINQRLKFCNLSRSKQFVFLQKPPAPNIDFFSSVTWVHCESQIEKSICELPKLMPCFPRFGKRVIGHVDSQKYKKFPKRTNSRTDFCTLE